MNPFRTEELRTDADSGPRSFLQSGAAREPSVPRAGGFFSASAPARSGPGRKRARGRAGSGSSFSLRLVLGVLALIASSAAAEELVLTQAPIRPDLKWEQPASRLDPFVAMERARVVVVSPDGTERVLSGGFDSACDPDVSPDGTKILFAGRRDRADCWSIWEIHRDGSQLRRITPTDRDCRHPIYTGQLFTLDAPAPWETIVFVGRNGALNELQSARSTSLFLANLDGSESRRITFNPSDESDPYQMPDGRILYAAWQFDSEGAEPPGRVSLFGINLDGTDGEAFHLRPGNGIQRMPCLTKGGRVVFVESEMMAWDGAGQLASVWRRRPHHTREQLTDDPFVRYRDPAPWENDEVLVSRRDLEKSNQFGVWRFDCANGESAPVFDNPDFHDWQAKVIRSRSRPDGRSTPVDPERSVGVFYCLNIFDTDGSRQPHWRPGVVERLRVIQGVPEQAEGIRADEWNSRQQETDLPRLRRRIFGEVPVEQDGSFHFEVPADIPVELQALDNRGLALATCRWIWVKPKEQRGCIGCHEDPERVPENLFVQAVQKPARKLVAPPEHRRSIGFREDVWPVLKNSCATTDCHGGSGTPLRLGEGANVSGRVEAAKAYRMLLTKEAGGAGSELVRPYVQAGRARASPLIWVLFGESTCRAWDPVSAAGTATTHTEDHPVTQMPPHNTTSLTAEERQLVIEWIDLGAAWQAESLAPSPQVGSLPSSP